MWSDAPDEASVAADEAGEEEGEDALLFDLLLLGTRPSIPEAALSVSRSLSI